MVCCVFFRIMDVDGEGCLIENILDFVKLLGVWVKKMLGFKFGLV